MPDAASQIAAMEESRFEENKRYNAERQISAHAGPGQVGRTESKPFVQSAVRSIPQRLHRFQFECEEPDVTIRSKSTAWWAAIVRLLDWLLRLIRSSRASSGKTSGINGTSGNIGLTLAGSNVFFFTWEKVASFLPHFVAQRMIQLTR